MNKYVISLTFLAVVCKIIGFFREIVMSYSFGASEFSDIYLMASSAAAIFLGWLTSFATIHTTIFQELNVKKGIKQAESFTNQIIFFQLVIGFVISIILYIFSNNIIFFVAKGFTSERVLITASFFRFNIIANIITAVAEVIISELNCKKLYLKAYLSYILSSVCQLIIILFCGVTNNFYGLRFTSIMSALIQITLLIIICFSNKRSNKLKYFYKKYIKKFFILLIPIFLSSMMDELNAFVDKVFGSYLPVGSISSLNYAHIIKQLFFYVFVTAVITIFYPEIAKQINLNENDKVKNTINKTISYLVFIFSFLVIFVVFFSKPITTIIYKRGAFDNQAVIRTSQCLMMYTLALLPLAIREVLIRTFMAMQDTKINFFTGLFSTIVNIILNVLLVSKLKHMGLALSTSIAAFLTLPILFICLKRKLLNYDIKGIVPNILKSIIASIVSILLPLFFYLKNESQIVSLWQNFIFMFISFLISLLLYFIFTKLLKINPLEEIIKSFKNKK